MEEEIKYNVLIIPNNEIGDQSVTSKFNIGWEEVLSSLRSIVIAKIDTSGSLGRGEEWLKSIRGQIGARESDEILASMRYLRSLHYVTEKMGITGQSYGGHVALSTMNSDFNDVISCGTVLSPIVDYAYMNSYVHTKYNIPAGYHISQGPKLLKSAANMKKHSLFLLHGTLNDRVQFQHTAQYIKSLVDAGVSHMQQIYPDVRNIFDSHLLHVVNSIERFYIDCFGLDPNSDPVYIVEDEEED
ncbi:inactive dipeptidyl peptidase 10-like [Mya arenaria]|nr:inactive dipeptidyl peptidase 10-like [Mya arenaria]